MPTYLSSNLPIFDLIFLYQGHPKLDIIFLLKNVGSFLQVIVAVSFCSQFVLLGDLWQQATEMLEALHLSVKIMTNIELNKFSFFDCLLQVGILFFSVWLGWEQVLNKGHKMSYKVLCDLFNTYIGCTQVVVPTYLSTQVGTAQAFFFLSRYLYLPRQVPLINQQIMKKHCRKLFYCYDVPVGLTDDVELYHLSDSFGCARPSSGQVKRLAQRGRQAGMATPLYVKAATSHALILLRT